MYMVAGARLEPLLGDHDTEDLGIVSFNPEGRPQQGDKSHKDVRNVSIPAMLRKADKEVVTERPPLRKVKTKGKEEANQILNRYKGPVFTDRVGRMKVEEVKLRYVEGFKPVQPARYPVPYHYKERLGSGHAPEEARGGGRDREGEPSGVRRLHPKHRHLGEEGAGRHPHEHRRQTL